MTAKDKLYKLLSIGLIEIRAESYTSKNKKIFELSHLLHNLPSELNDDKVNYDNILAELISSAEHNNKDLSEWLKLNLDMLSKQLN